MAGLAMMLKWFAISLVLDEMVIFLLPMPVLQSIDFFSRCTRLTGNTSGRLKFYV